MGIFRRQLPIAPGIFFGCAKSRVREHFEKFPRGLCDRIAAVNPGCFFEGLAQSPIDGFKNDILLLEPHLMLGGMHVDIDLIERNRQKEDDTGLPSMQEFLIGLIDSRIDRFIFDDATIDKSIEAPRSRLRIFG